MLDILQVVTIIAIVIFLIFAVILLIRISHLMGRLSEKIKGESLAKKEKGVK
ncbi:MAG: hypothetical protein ACE5K3_07885 [bacterium]